MSREPDTHPTLGIIVPDDGPFDYEWYRLDPWLAAHGLGDVTVYIEGSPADGYMNPQSLAHTGSHESLRAPAMRLRERGAGAIVWACTSGSFIGGHAFARDQVEWLQRETGLPATSTSLALVAAAHHLEAGVVDILCTYTAAVSAVLIGLVEQSGLEVRHWQALEAVHSEDSVAVPVEQTVYEFHRAHAGPQHPLLIPDTSCNTLHLIEGLEAELDRPIITANAASLWHGLRLLDVDTAGRGVGRLFGRSV